MRTLFGRSRECGLLDQLISGVRTGHGGVLVIDGEPGIGKTALLDYAAAAAPDLRLVRATGVEAETDLAFASLHQVCVPMMEHLDGLPQPQRDALRTAFGFTSGPRPGRLLLGVATLGLLSGGADAAPLVCLVDDAQWIDRSSAQALAFAARRLAAESVVLVLAAREPSADFGGLPSLHVDGLAETEARRLLASVVRWPFDERVRDRIVAETAGNPLALLESLHERSPAQLAGGFGIPPGAAEEEVAARLAALAPATRRLLLIAAAEPVGDPTTIWRAARRLGVPDEAAAAAVEAGLLDASSWVRFTHPSARATAYGQAAASELREVHQALAHATDAAADPDRRAWHRAQAAQGPDDDVAADLERSAARAQARGGLAASAAFLARAADLTSDPALRSGRALHAADAKFRAGAFEAADDLLSVAEAVPLDEAGRIRIDLLRARLAYATQPGGGAVASLLGAARRLEAIDVDAARSAYLDAFSAAKLAGRLADDGGTARDVAEAFVRTPAPLRRPAPADLLLGGLAAHYREGIAASVSLLRAGISHDPSTQEELRAATVAAVHLWEDGEWDRHSGRHVDLARRTGALSELPVALGSRIPIELFSGRLASAAALVAEMAAVRQVTGSRLAAYGAVAVAAFRGDEEETAELAEKTQTDVRQRGEGLGITATEWARAVLFNGHGRYDEARSAAEVAVESVEPGRSCWALVELVEAAARSGAVDRAEDALRDLSGCTVVCGTDWALGVLARSRAVVAGGDHAERLYHEAISRLAVTRMRTEEARAHLMYGEWLRRENRRVDARDQLHQAYEMLAGMGLAGFADRARHELLATGETVRKRRVDTTNDLTAQEAQIARLARDGLSNPEIGTQLFISVRTVEWHMHKVFTKLDITSRRQLRQVLPPSGRA